MIILSLQVYLKTYVFANFKVFNLYCSSFIIAMLHGSKSNTLQNSLTSKPLHYQVLISKKVKTVLTSFSFHKPTLIDINFIILFQFLTKTILCQLFLYFA